MTHRLRFTFLFWIAFGYAQHHAVAVDFTYNFRKLLTVTPAAGRSVYIGNFGGDGLKDIATYNPTDGSVFVGVRSEFGSYQFYKYATVYPSAGWKFVPGNFTDANSYQDLFAYHPSDGSVWVGRNTGSAFKFVQWETISPGNAWAFSGGHFKGADYLTDGVAYHPSDGSVWVLRNLLGSFKTTIWGWLTPASGWTVVGTGFFTGDWSGDFSDVVFYRPDDGQIMVGQGISSSSAFFFMRFAKMQTGANWTFTTLGQRAPGATISNYQHLLGYNYPTGTLWVGNNEFGSRFQFSKVPTNLPVGPKWRFVAGYLEHGNLYDNILAYNPATGALWLGEVVQ